MSAPETPRAPFIPRELLSLCTRRLEALCHAAGFAGETRPFVNKFNHLLGGSGEQDIEMPKHWLSEVSDDNTPIELSAAISDERVQVRALFEAQAREGTLQAYRKAALALTDRLESDYGVNLRRFRAVEDLFLPEDMQGPFALWHSAVFNQGEDPSFKVYFNPQARGRGRAQALVEEGLARIGMERAWSGVCATATRGPHLDELKYFALDLRDDPTARVKVYMRHYNATAEDLERACSVARTYVPGEVTKFVRAMSGDVSHLQARATFTCSAFIGNDPRPAATTVYVPICAYVNNDAAARDRVVAYLTEHGINPAPYLNLINGYSHRRLEDGVGLQSWVAFRNYGTPRLTVYISTEARHVHAPGSVPAATEDRHAFGSPQEVIQHLRDYDPGQHPFVRRLLREGDSATLSQMARSLDAVLGQHAPADPAKAQGARFARELAVRQISSAIARRSFVPLDLAQLTNLTSSELEAAYRGAVELHQALWHTLDVRYGERYGSAPAQMQQARKS